jgi:Domain of unknown function (DUF4365)
MRTANAGIAVALSGHRRAIMFSRPFSPPGYHSSLSQMINILTAICSPPPWTPYERPGCPEAGRFLSRTIALEHEMTDALMAVTDREEALSRAYIAAVAARAGYLTATMDFDRDGVDIQIRAGGTMRPSLDIQLKATINLGEPKGGVFRFPLKRRNYDLLVAETMIPRILVVLDLPKDQADWLQVTSDRLIMRRCAYWASLVAWLD